MQSIFCRDADLPTLRLSHRDPSKHRPTTPLFLFPAHSLCSPVIVACVPFFVPAKETADKVL